MQSVRIPFDLRRMIDIGVGLLLVLVAALFLFGGTGCRHAAQSRTSSPQPILEVNAVREPDGPLPAGASRTSPPSYDKNPGWYGSRIAIFDDGSVQYRVSAWKSCTSDCPAYGWVYRWDNTREQVFSGKIDQAEMVRLKASLEHEGKGLEGYANQGPQVGDFQILVRGASGQQSGSVIFGLQPAWGISRPYVDLICEAKAIAQLITPTAPIPDWCRKARK